jgi:DNA processing protein
VDTQELQAWLRLTLSPGVGNDAARKLLAAFGSAQAVFGQSAAALKQLGGDKLAKAILPEPPALAAQLQLTLDWLQAGEDRRVATLGDTA